MDLFNPLPAIAVLLTALTTAYLIAKFFGAPPAQGRFAAIDGLRGYLAFFVFIYHSVLWYSYLRTGQWEVPPSNLYTHFGQSSVALFFMITGFLFFSKILDGREKEIDWLRLFVSRFLRLTPLYLFVMLLLLVIVMLLKNGVINGSYLHLAENLIYWCAFTIFGSPDLNSFEDTLIIVSGVTWTLPYEWLFYFLLPALALMVRLVPPLPYIALSVASIAIFSVYHPQTHPLHPHTHPLFAFIGGIASALLVRQGGFRCFCSRNSASFLIFGLIILIVAVFPSAYGVAPLILLSFVFSLIAGGNNLFKILVHPVSRTLGELSYSIYLLHGMILFILFTFMTGKNNAKLFSPDQHWIMITIISPILLLISYCTFHFIEKPAMQSVNTVTVWLRSHLTWRLKIGTARAAPLNLG